MRRLTQLRHRTFGRLQTKVHIDSPDSLTRIGDEAPTTLDMGAVWTRVVDLYRTGLHPAIGLTVRHRGHVIVDRTLGHVHHHPGQAAGPIATPDTPFNLFSASKILTGLVVQALIEDGRMSLEDPAVTYLPEIRGGGRERIRIRHLLNHTAGIPNLPPGIDVVSAIREGTIPWHLMADLPLMSVPGEKVAYHPVTSWVLLEEICNRLSGKDLRTLANDRLLAPLGLGDMNYGIAADRVHEVAKHARTGITAPRLISGIFERTIGVDLDTGVALTNEPAFLTAILPSANVVATGRQVTSFLQMLLNGGELNGTRVLQNRTIQRAIDDTTPTRLDGTFGFPMRYGLGLMRGGTAFSLFGFDTPHAFGHLGFTNVVVYADPSRDLAVSFLNTGKPMLAPGMIHWYRVLQTLARTVPAHD